MDYEESARILWDRYLKRYELNMILSTVDGEVIGCFEEIPLFSEGNEVEVIADLKEQLVEYAEMVVEDLEYFLTDGERMGKLPHLMKVYLFPGQLDEFINIKRAAVN